MSVYFYTAINRIRNIILVMTKFFLLKYAARKASITHYVNNRCPDVFDKADSRIIRALVPWVYKRSRNIDSGGCFQAA